MTAVLLSLLSALALSQADAGPSMSAETDDRAADVQRTLGPGVAAEAGEGDAGTPAAAAAQGEAPAPTPTLADDIDGKIGAALRLSETLVSWFPVDDQGNYVGPRPFETRLRVAP